ncbi:MAG: histidine phosphatase family protein [Cytophagaceae bacterium]|nr:histidine phosphatase family protein [Cytophagaceae bacterium]MDW8456783.1 histidine phosphatase family protein [Cytophagaceae bacterium]
MQGKKIYLIRHGQTDYNLHGIVQGSGVDSDLNETGRKQAELFYKKYHHVPFKKIYTSTLKRTLQSVEPFLDLGIPVQSFEGLNEINWGKKEGQKVEDSEHDLYFSMIKKWREGHTHLRPEGGESPDEVLQRMLPVIDYIEKQIHEDIILVCMHGRSIRILLAHLINNDISKMDDYKHENFGLYILDYNNRHYTIELKNDLSHLM